MIADIQRRRRRRGGGDGGGGLFRWEEGGLGEGAAAVFVCGGIRCSWSSRDEVEKGLQLCLGLIKAGRCRDKHFCWQSGGEARLRDDWVLAMRHWLRWASLARSWPDAEVEDMGRCYCRWSRGIGMAGLVVKVLAAAG